MSHRRRSSSLNVSSTPASTACHGLPKQCTECPPPTVIVILHAAVAVSGFGRVLALHAQGPEFTHIGRCCASMNAVMALTLSSKAASASPARSASTRMCFWSRSQATSSSFWRFLSLRAASNASFLAQAAMNDAVRSRPSQVVVEDRLVTRARSGRRACCVAGPVAPSPFESGRSATC